MWNELIVYVVVVVAFAFDAIYNSIHFCMRDSTLFSFLALFWFGCCCCCRCLDHSVCIYDDRSSNLFLIENISVCAAGVATILLFFLIRSLFSLLSPIVSSSWYSDSVYFFYKFFLSFIFCGIIAVNSTERRREEK